MTPADEMEEKTEAAAPAAREPLSRILLVRIPYLIAGTLLLAGIAINFANIVGRYVFSAPIFWTEEMLTFLIIWSVFVCAGAITYLGTHLNMDMFVHSMTPAFRRFLGGLTVVLMLATTSFVATQSLRILLLYRKTGESSMAAHIPLIYAHSAVLVGCILMAVAALVRIPAYLRSEFD